jgi:hypothetical protein
MGSTLRAASHANQCRNLVQSCGFVWKARKNRSIPRHDFTRFTTEAQRRETSLGDKKK